MTLLMLVTPVLIADTEEDGIYLSGFVKDSNGVGIKDAVIIITDRHRNCSPYDPCSKAGLNL